LNGNLNWQGRCNSNANIALLDRDLFLKPQTGRGARGAMSFHRIDPFRYRGKDGRIWTADEILSYLQEHSTRGGMLLQPMLTNHPTLHGLAQHSLIVFRLVTCLDEGARPVITHAMLRVLAKLEPTWPGKYEYAAAVDLTSGQLGPMCNDKDLAPDAWSETHPVTGSPVAGRRIDQWDAIRDLAITGHQAFKDRLLIGWDIALTPTGPVLVEANSYPDVHFLQRVHRQAIGASELGPLLQSRLEQLLTRDKQLLAQTPARSSI
jgi:hypothetical protein